jgi:ribokinase
VVLASQTGVAHFPAFKVGAVDTTGAGDTFVGALSVALVSEMDIGEAVQLAQRAAAFSVTRRGGQASMPNAGELAAFFAGRAA